VPERLIARIEEVAPGSLHRVDIDGATLCIARTHDGEVHVIDGICTHEAFPLDEGDLVGDEVECPQHGSRFHVRTGAATELPAEVPVRVYPVRIRDGAIYVDV
jgi:3-phenylpropionate/trans-cinnamate dioxygenase ferredoxin subunit